MVGILLEGKAQVNQADARGRTPLHEAINKHGCNWYDDSLLRTLLKHGADVNAKDSEGKSCLHELLDGCRLKDNIVQLLKEFLAAGAKLNDPNRRGNTCLHIWAVAYKPSTSVLDFLLTSEADIS